ncbi:hypothetical protein NLI96_g12968 [Meripilus lineatus]|uniref:Uncharacterized protein n=1 Tax=Meripilus lineatus TaxID=2056292 RepID=A0AAD5Y9D7_9APHY|nr:hypothetical protein NLI96_g12968 [Physisporinus lineatus]
MMEKRKAPPRAAKKNLPTGPNGEDDGDAPLPVKGKKGGKKRTREPLRTDPELPPKFFRPPPEETDQMTKDRNHQQMVPRLKERSPEGRTWEQYKSLTALVNKGDRNIQCQIRAEFHGWNLREISRLEDVERAKFLDQFNADVAKRGGSRLKYDENAMKKKVGKSFALGKKEIHRRPKAGESRHNAKQDLATLISLRPSVVGRYPALEELKPTPCNRLDCLRKDDTMCKEGDLVLYRELPSCNPEGDTPESHVPSVAYTHWMCVTDRARILLRKEPQRMAYHYSLGQEDIDAVEADIAKARSKRKLAEYEPTSDDERRIENERADRRAEKRRARDEAYGAAFKNKKKWGRIRRNWEKRQKEIGSNATWQDDYRGLAEEL